MYISVSQNPDELERYKKYITDMFEMAGESNKQALEDAENVLNVEKLLSSDITAMVIPNLWKPLKLTALMTVPT